MKKIKVVNKGKFIGFIVVCVLVLAIIVVAVIGLTQTKDPSTCKHKWKDGICKRCGTSSEKLCVDGEGNHSFDSKDGVCTLCGYTCKHPSTKKGTCQVCGYYDANYVPDPRESWPASSTTSYPVSQVTDDYLILINKQYKLTASYVPNDLVEVPDDYRVAGVGSKSQKTNCLRSAAAAAFIKMVSEAANQEINIKMRTGYRSYEYQESLYQSNYEKEGVAANKSSAKAGESEHQLGLALDIGGESDGYYMNDNFLSTREGRWVVKNCAKYGFIIRFTDGTATEVGTRTGYISEPWHLRYVGVEAATIIMEQYKQDNNFTLEQYFEIVKEYQ